MNKLDIHKIAESLFDRNRPPTELECYLELINMYEAGKHSNFPFKCINCSFENNPFPNFQENKSGK